LHVAFLYHHSQLAMKKLLLTALAAALLPFGAAHAQAPTAEVQSLMQRVNQLMRNPAKPQQEIRLEMSGCHATQTIRDKDADVNMNRPIAVSYSKGQSGWAVNMADGFFELKMDFNWSDVKPLTYKLSDDEDKGERHYQINIQRQNQNGKGSTSFSLPLFTTDEGVVRDVVARLERVRKQCAYPKD
jgi:hypothetical protein